MKWPRPETSRHDAANLRRLSLELIFYTDVQTLAGPSRSENRATLKSSEVAELILKATAFATVLGAAVQAFAAVVLPLVKTVQVYVARPDVQARIHNAGVSLKAMHRAVEAVDAPGYTPYFEKMGQSGLSARFQAGMVRHFGKRFHAESQERRIALMAFHSLAKRRRWHPALAAQVARLCQNAPDADLLDQAFRDAGYPELKREFVALLQDTRDGDHPGGPRLIEIAAKIAPHAPSAKGRPLSFDSALHQAFLRWSRDMGGRQGYTYGPVRDSDKAVDDFIDEATAATRIELGRPSFNPISARRAVKRLFARKAEKKPRLT